MLRQRCPKETVPGRMEQRCGLRHRALSTWILGFKTAHWMGHSEDQMLRKDQRCCAEKRNTKSVSKGGSDRTLYSMAVPGFSLHSEEDSDRTIAGGVHGQGSAPEPDPRHISDFQFNSDVGWGSGVLGVMLGVTMIVLCHQSQRLSRNPHSSRRNPRFPTHPAASRLNLEA